MMLATLPIIVSVIFALACIVSLFQARIEQAFPRLILAVWYFYMWHHPEMPIETQKIIGLWSISFLGFIEVVSFFMRRWQTSEYTKAMRNGKHEL